MVVVHAPIVGDMLERRSFILIQELRTASCDWSVSATKGNSISEIAKKEVGHSPAKSGSIDQAT